MTPQARKVQWTHGTPNHHNPPQALRREDLGVECGRRWGVFFSCVHQAHRTRQPRSPRVVGDFVPSRAIQDGRGQGFIQSCADRVSESAQLVCSRSDSGRQGSVFFQQRRRDSEGGARDRTLDRGASQNNPSESLTPQARKVQWTHERLRLQRAARQRPP